jgi:hypothetical protein
MSLFDHKSSYDAIRKVIKHVGQKKNE